MDYLKYLQRFLVCFGFLSLGSSVVFIYYCAEVGLGDALEQLPHFCGVSLMAALITTTLNPLDQR